MKRVTITLLAFIMLASAAHANIFHIGPRLGGSISQLEVDLDKNTSAYQDLNLKAGLGYHVGIFTRLSLPLFYIQPELLVGGIGASFKDETKKEISLSFTKVDFPVMVGFSFLDIVRAQAGPMVSWLLRATEGGQSVEDNYSTATFGWQAGLGVDILDIIIDFKYEGNFSKFGDKIHNLDVDQGYGLWILSVGYNIF